jgi:hypothetical protein
MLLALGALYPESVLLCYCAHEASNSYKLIVFFHKEGSLMMVLQLILDY